MSEPVHPAAEAIMTMPNRHSEAIMKLPRRTLLKFVGAVAAVTGLPRITTAQTYPTRPITLISPMAAGSSSDVVGRVVTGRMSKSLGQPIITENVSGADGTIGTGRAARAVPDGYTINLGVTSSHVLNGAFYSLSYDVLNDFAPISPLITGSLVLYARKTMPAKDLRELIAWLKSNPNKASAGVFAVGYRLMNTLLQRQTGTQFTLIPYRGSPPEVQDLVAGQIDLCFDTPVLLPLVRAGSIKAYAVTSDTRMAIAPEIPTFAEMGLPTLSFRAWYGLFAPKDTPRDVIAKLNAVTVEALADPAVRSRLSDLGFQVFPRAQQTPEGLRARQKADIEKWWPIIKELMIDAE
jgi:tripartite-type tricarboxylate transporter receptor subunit TctC